MPFPKRLLPDPTPPGLKYSAFRRLTGLPLVALLTLFVAAASSTAMLSDLCLASLSKSTTSPGSSQAQWSASLGLTTSWAPVYSDRHTLFVDPQPSVAVRLPLKNYSKAQFLSISLSQAFLSFDSAEGTLSPGWTSVSASLPNAFGFGTMAMQDKTEPRLTLTPSVSVTRNWNRAALRDGQRLRLGVRLGASFRAWSWLDLTAGASYTRVLFAETFTSLGEPVNAHISSLRGGFVLNASPSTQWSSGYTSFQRIPLVGGRKSYSFYAYTEISHSITQDVQATAGMQILDRAYINDRRNWDFFEPDLTQIYLASSFRL